MLGYGFQLDGGRSYTQQRRITTARCMAIIALIALGLLVICFRGCDWRSESDVLQNTNQRPAVLAGIETSTGYANDVYGVQTGLVAAEGR